MRKTNTEQGDGWIEGGKGTTRDYEKNMRKYLVDEALDICIYVAKMVAIRRCKSILKSKYETDKKIYEQV